MPLLKANTPPQRDLFTVLPASLLFIVTVSAKGPYQQNIEIKEPLTRDSLNSAQQFNNSSLCVGYVESRQHCRLNTPVCI